VPACPLFWCALQAIAFSELLYTEAGHSSGFFLRKKPPCQAPKKVCVYSGNALTHLAASQSCAAV
jgi:hypothetical protein